jgi:hypothetical protein
VETEYVVGAGIGHAACPLFIHSLRYRLPFLRIYLIDHLLFGTSGVSPCMYTIAVTHIISCTLVS